MITIYHKPSCSTSRQVLAMLKEKTNDIRIIQYMENPLSVDDLRALVKKLKIPASGLVRKKEALFKEKYAAKEFSEEQWIKILSEHPILMERPVVVNGNKAVLCRPKERVAEIF